MFMWFIQGRCVQEAEIGPSVLDLLIMITMRLAMLSCGFLRQNRCLCLQKPQRRIMYVKDHSMPPSHLC